MVKLLMRFYDVNKGAILIDDINIKDFKREDLRKMFGMVLQDTWLFGGTIKENIKYSKEDATDTEVIEAAKAALEKARRQNQQAEIMQSPDQQQAQKEIA